MHIKLAWFAFCFVIFVEHTDAPAQNRPTDITDRIKDLRDSSAETRLKAIEELGRDGANAAQAVSQLTDALNDEDPGVRWGAGVVLVKIGPGAVGQLMHAIVDTHANIRRGAASVLGRIGPAAERALPSLVRALRDPDENVRENAAESLGELGPEATPAVDALMSCLADTDAILEGKTAEALSRIGRSAVPRLARALSDTCENVRWCAAIALSKMGDAAAEAVPALIQALQDSSANVRWCTVLELGKLGKRAEAAWPALVRMLPDRDEDVRWGVNTAMADIDSEAFGMVPHWSSVASTINTLTPELMHELHVPGVSIALISNRTMVWTKSYGVTDVMQRTPVTRETAFEACSMSKPVFAYAILKLVEEGKLDLDRPLVQYLALPSLVEGEYSGRITARMVLSHSSGLPNWRKGEEERDGPLPVMFRPGSRFGYSGEGMFYLQRVAEHITGEPLEVYSARMLFRPLGLTHTSFVWTEGMEATLASGHNADGTFLRKTRYTHANAAYTLYTTAKDYALFLLEIMNPDRSAKHSLSKHSIEGMLSPQITADVREPIARPGRAKGLSVSWGLGWCIDTTSDGNINYHSGANRSGFRCYCQFSVRRGSGIVIMTNGVKGGEFWSRLLNTVGNL